MHGCDERLVRLTELRNESATEGMPDLNGWEVIAADGRAVGTVVDLVLDTRSLKARYLDISLNEELTRAVAHQPNILIPVGDARIGTERRRVYLEGVDRRGVSQLPAYLRMPPAPELEVTLRRRFEPHFSGTALDRDFFASELYDQDRFFEAGSASKSPP